MDDKILEKYFHSIQNSFIGVNERLDGVNERLDRHETTLIAVLEIVSEYDTDRRKMKSDIWDLQKAVAELQITINPAKRKTV